MNEQRQNSLEKLANGERGREEQRLLRILQHEQIEGERKNAERRRADRQRTEG